MANRDAPFAGRKQVPIPTNIPEGKFKASTPLRATTQMIYAPWTTQQVYTFAGSLTNGIDESFFSFIVLAGDTGPKVTAGLGAKLAINNRPQRLGYTVPNGYDPIAVDIPIQFEAVVRQPVARGAVGQPGIPANIENDIQILEWMAGRGKLYFSSEAHGVGAPATGDPPLVQVASYHPDGTESNLMPPNYQGVTWVVTNIAYGPEIRNRNADRTRQPATVSLTQFVAAPGTTFDSPSTRQHARATNKGFVTFTTGDGVNTYAKVLDHYNKNTAANKKVIVAYNLSRLKVRSVNQLLPRGTKVKVPNSILIT